MSRKAVRLLGFALVLLLIALTGITLWVTYNFAYSIVRPARVPVTLPLANAGLGAAREVSFPTTNNLTLRGWYTAPTIQPARAVILVHGHAANRVNMLGRAQWYVERGYGVLMFDLRAHGESEGEICTLGYVEREDVIAAFNFLSAQPEIDPQRIILQGESMGGAASIMATPDLPTLRALIVESTFSTFEENIEEGVRTSTGLPAFPFAPLILFFGEREAQASISLLRPIDVIDDFAPRPLLIMHGEQDSLLNVANAHRLFAAARDPKELVLFPTAGHVGLFENDQALWEAHVSAFLERVFES